MKMSPLTLSLSRERRGKFEIAAPAQADSERRGCLFLQKNRKKLSPHARCNPF